MAHSMNLTRFSLTQLYCEERKQRAHLKKITDMQRHNGLDNQSPPRFPHLRQGFVRQSNEKSQEILKENQSKSKRLIDIMASKREEMPEPFHPKNPIHRRPNYLTPSTSHAEYLQRIAKAKGKYDVREWRKSYEKHQEHLKIRKDHHVFTPLGIGVNRQRLKTISNNVISKRSTPSSPVLNLTPTTNRNDHH